MAYVISRSEDPTAFCLQTADVADKTISFAVTTRPPFIPVCATFHPSAVISLPCCAYIRNTCPFYPHLTVPTTPIKCKSPTQKQLSRSIRILKHINRIRLTAECVCCAAMLIIGKGEEQDQKMAAIKSDIYEIDIQRTVHRGIRVFKLYVFPSTNCLQYKLKVKDHISQTQPSLLVFVQNYDIKATCFEL